MDGTSIITTLMGAMLAIISGFLATYLTQVLTGRAEKRKVMREKSEELYTLINEVEDKIHLSTIEISFSSRENTRAVEARIATVKLFTEVASYVNKIEMIANLYLHEAVYDTNIYCNELKEIIAKIVNSLDSNVDIDKVVFSAFTKIEIAHKKIQETLVKINMHL